MYTREAGLVRAAAKGARKPSARLAGHLEPGTLSEIYVARSRGMGQIASAITINSFEKIKSNFEKLRKALKVLGFFVKNFSEGEKDERIFELLKEFLEILGAAEQEEIFAEAFWWKLFDLQGQRPEVMKCVKCAKRLQKNMKNFFSVSRGGVICENCAKSRRGLPEISENEIKLMRLFLTNSLDKFLKVKAGKRELSRLGRLGEEFRRYNFV